ncbi:hypothetical protein SAMN05421740_11077 [Parapedobacter koreensis]|uniref:Uncharacterized protein n=1 Tax=Parapedobacter koreensis TaxID=332977 RepID=A0A1H7T5H5_9SPHI|nr:hypothetical protein SAMN05421740_11077 [Parapedobacter koreensis]
MKHIPALKKYIPIITVFSLLLVPSLTIGQDAKSTVLIG